MRAAVATAFNDPETAERLLRNVIKSAPASNDADEAYGMLLQIYLWSGQCGRWVTTYRQWVAAIPSSARARAEEGDEKGLVGQPDQVNSRPRCAVLRHDSGDLTIPVSVDGTVDAFLFDTGAWHSVMTARMAARLGMKIDATNRVLRGSSRQSRAADCDTRRCLFRSHELIHFCPNVPDLSERWLLGSHSPAWCQ